MKIFQVGALSVSKQRPRSNMTVIARNKQSKTIIVHETQGNQMPVNSKQKNGETDDSFFASPQTPAATMILNPNILNLLGSPLSTKQITFK